jgi:hypothetical protein
MAHWIRRSVIALVGMALGVGCVSTQSDTRGELELLVEPAVAAYDVVGRFRLTGLEAGTLDRELVLDGVSSRASVALPPGRYSLTLQPGASVQCAEGAREVLDALDDGVWRAPGQLVSAAPRLVTIAPGETSSARIRLDVQPQRSDTTPSSSEHSPCAPSAATVLSRR